MTRSPIRAAGEVIESRLAPEPNVKTRALVKIGPMRGGVILGRLAPERKGERRGMTAEDRKCENEVRQASAGLSGGPRLAVNEAGNEVKADLPVEPGLIADQGSLVGPGIQTETGIHLNVGITVDRDPDAQ